MLGKIATGVAALGLIGGAGSVAWHDGTPTVKVKDANGVTHSTNLEMGGQDYRCPSGEREKLAPIVEEAGRIKITIDAGVADESRYNSSSTRTTRRPMSTTPGSTKTANRRRRSQLRAFCSPGEGASRRGLSGASRR